MNLKGGGNAERFVNYIAFEMREICFKSVQVVNRGGQSKQKVYSSKSIVSL